MITPAAANLPRRYPGLKPFDRNQSAVFHGRREDVQRLTNLIVRERLVVLFAKSGIGKTSMLQAGVAPLLEGQDFLPIFLRADKTDAPLSTTLGEVLSKSPQVGHVDATGLRPGLRQTLWEQMKRLEFDLDGLPATPVLVFDQFEEVFTLGHDEASRSQFLLELADLANEAVPEAVRADLLAGLQDATPLSTELMHWWERQPELRVVISIRSDFLHLLDDISPLIPGILRNRYQLQPLNRQQAQTAIEDPAKAAGAFASPPFAYRPDAIKGILDFLAGRASTDGVQEVSGLPALKKQDEIESFNLQILCQNVEGNIISQQQPAGFEVIPDFYGGHEGLEEEIRDFYQKQLQQLPEIYVRKTGQAVDNAAQFVGKAQCLIEEDLVTPIGRRCSMVDDFLTNKWQVSHDFLDTLVDSRLLRKELRLDDFYYEISHDTLLPAVIESRDARRKREHADDEKAKLQAELAEEAARRERMEGELRTARMNRKLARQVAITSFIALLITLVFGILVARNYASSVRNELAQAEENVYNEQYAAGLNGYQNLTGEFFKCWLLEHTRPHKSVESGQADALRFQHLYGVITQDFIAQGDSLYFQENEDFAGALAYYRDAQDSLQLYKSINYPFQGGQRKNGSTWRVNPLRIKDQETSLTQRTESALKTLIVQFDIRQRDVETFIEARAWNQALRSLLAMQHLLPTRPADLDRLQKSLHLDDRPDKYVQEEIARCYQMLGR